MKAKRKPQGWKKQFLKYRDENRYKYQTTRTKIHWYQIHIQTQLLKYLKIEVQTQFLKVQLKPTSLQYNTK